MARRPNPPPRRSAAAAPNHDRNDQQGRSVAAHVRDRQRRVAEREAARLAKPEIRPAPTLGHADRTKSAVTSTPAGVLTKQSKDLVVEPTEWCGPFSVARQMIAKREEARRLRELELEGEQTETHPLDEVMEEVELDLKRKAHPSLLWKSRVPNANEKQSIYAKRQKRVDVVSQSHKVPSLFQLCVNFLVDNFEHVESLGDIENSIRSAVAKELVSRGKMNIQSFQSIAEVGIEALELVDCSEITQDQLSKSLQQLLPGGLRYLVLDQAGRCFGPKTVEAFLSTRDSKLEALSVGGAYLLKDGDAAKLLTHIAQNSSAIEFKACPLLGQQFTAAISDAYAPSTHRLVELSLLDISLSKEHLETLVSKPSALLTLKSLSLRRIEGLDDEIVDKILEVVGDTLQNLDLSDGFQLTDSSLASIRRYCCNLRALALAGCKHLTAHGLEALFLHVPGMESPPMLRSLDLGNCDFEAVTDEVMNLATLAATRKRDGGVIVDQILLTGGLVRVNLQGSSLISDASLEYLVATAAGTLETLNLSFCPHVSDQGMGYLVDKCGNQLSNLEIWGCAQLSDTFLDGHRRCNDPTFEIAGAWMKKSTTKTIR